MVLFDIIGTLLAFLPVWFVFVVIVCIGFTLATILLKIVAFVMDLLPFI